MKALDLSIAFAALALVTACDEETFDSTDVSTLDLRISIDAEDLGEGATVRTRISSPLGAIRLTGGDTLRMSMGGAPLPLREIEEYGSPVLLSEIDSLSDDFILDLERPSDRSIMGRVVDVPPPIELSAAPMVGDAPLVISWSGAPEGAYNLHLVVTGPCIRAISRGLPNDVGAYQIIQAELFPANAGTPTPCPLEVMLTRSVRLQEPLAPPATTIGLYAWITVSRAVEVSWTK